jgi:hypothetical protein
MVCTRRLPIFPQNAIIALSKTPIKEGNPDDLAHSDFYKIKKASNQIRPVVVFLSII